MATRFSCTRCSFTIELQVGKYVACPKCGGVLIATPVEDPPQPEDPTKVRKKQNNQGEHSFNPAAN